MDLLVSPRHKSTSRFVLGAADHVLSVYPDRLRLQNFWAIHWLNKALIRWCTRPSHSIILSTDD